MRTSSAIVLCMVTAFLFPSSSFSANHPGDKTFTAAVGYAVSHNDDAYETADALTFSIAYQKTRNASYRASIGFVTVEARNPQPNGENLPDADATFVMGNLVLNARFSLLNPYLTFGVGVYSVRLTGQGDSSNNLELGANWGAGIDVQVLRQFAIRGEILFHYTTGDVSNPIDTITIGGRFTF